MFDYEAGWEQFEEEIAVWQEEAQKRLGRKLWLPKPQSLTKKMKKNEKKSLCSAAHCARILP